MSRRKKKEILLFLSVPLDLNSPLNLKFFLRPERRYEFKSALSFIQSIYNEVLRRIWYRYDINYYILISTNPAQVKLIPVLPNVVSSSGTVPPDTDIFFRMSCRMSCRSIPKSLTRCMSVYKGQGQKRLSSTDALF